MSVCVSVSAGRALTEREKVSAQIISNWFANKRKELKKLAREGFIFTFFSSNICRIICRISVIFVE